MKPSAHRTDPNRWRIHSSRNFSDLFSACSMNGTAVLYWQSGSAQIKHRFKQTSYMLTGRGVSFWFHLFTQTISEIIILKQNWSWTSWKEFTPVKTLHSSCFHWIQERSCYVQTEWHHIPSVFILPLLLVYQLGLLQVHINACKSPLPPSFWYCWHPLARETKSINNKWQWTDSTWC